MDAIDKLGELVKGEARGGKYYRRVATGNAKHPWKYYYTKVAYDREHGDGAHRNGDDEKKAKLGKQAKEIQRSKLLSEYRKLNVPSLRYRQDRRSVDKMSRAVDIMRALGVKSHAEVQDILDGGSWKPTVPAPVYMVSPPAWPKKKKRLPSAAEIDKMSNKKLFGPNGLVHQAAEKSMAHEMPSNGFQAAEQERAENLRAMGTLAKGEDHVILPDGDDDPNAAREYADAQRARAFHKSFGYDDEPVGIHDGACPFHGRDMFKSGGRDHLAVPGVVCTCK